jgi:hypothetical protein
MKLLFCPGVIDELDFNKEMYYISYNYCIEKLWDGKYLLRAVRSVNIIVDKKIICGQFG